MRMASGWWPPARGERRWALGASSACLGVFALGLAAVHYAPHGSLLAAWWPAGGLAVAALAHSPPRRRSVLLVGLLLAVSLAALLAGRPPLLALALGAVNTAGAAVVVAVLRRRSPGRAELRTMEDLLLLVLGTALGGVVVGLGVATLFALGLGTPFWATARTVFASQAASVLLIAPLGMDVRGPGAGAGQVERWLQPVLAAAAVVACSPHPRSCRSTSCRSPC